MEYFAFIGFSLLIVITSMFFEKILDKVSSWIDNP